MKPAAAYTKDVSRTQISYYFTMLYDMALGPTWQALHRYRAILQDDLRFKVVPFEHRRSERELRDFDDFVRTSTLGLAYLKEYWYEARDDMEGKLYYDEAGALRFLFFVVGRPMADALERQDATAARVAFCLAGEAWSDAGLPEPQVEWRLIRETVELLSITPVFIWASQTPAIVLRNAMSAEEALRDIIRHDPDAIFRVTPREFEQLIALVLREQGFAVELTQATRDGGRDIIAIHEVLGLRSKLLIECKRYAPSTTVGLAVVQRLYGIKTSERATKAVLATTSSFTRDAREFASQHVWELDLRAYDDIMGWIRGDAG